MEPGLSYILDTMDPSRAPIRSLQAALGRALSLAIDAQGGKVAFARRAGLHRATLYRLLRGDNVSTEVLLRTLRALGRVDLIAQLVAEPERSPLERMPPRARRASLPTASQPSNTTSPVERLQLGRPTEND